LVGSSAQASSSNWTRRLPVQGIKPRLDTKRPDIPAHPHKSFQVTGHEFPLVCLTRSFKQLVTPAICTGRSKASEGQALDTLACPHKSSRATHQEIPLVVRTISIRQLDTPIVCARLLDNVGGTSTGQPRLFNNVKGASTKQLDHQHKSSQATGKTFSATKSSSYPQFGSITSNQRKMGHRTMIC
jgi:hypothetical protein